MTTAYGSKVNALISKIRSAGFPARFVHSVLPEWVSRGVDYAPGALDEIKVSLARRLGLDLGALVDRDVVELSLPLQVKFKGATLIEEAGLKSPFVAYCSAVARAICSAMPDRSVQPRSSGEEERSDILADESVKWISLNALLRRCWEDLNVAVVFVPAGPRTKRGFDAATFKIGDRFVVLLAKRVPHASWASFILAHELGHIADGHLKDGEVILDRDPSADAILTEGDSEENAADRYALAVLGGAGLVSVKATGTPSAGGLAKAAAESGRERRIDPGHLVLRYARETGEWQLAQAALRSLQRTKFEMAVAINDVALERLSLDELGDDARVSVEAALGPAS